MDEGSILPEIAIIGGGRMGRALLEGWRGAGVPNDRIVVFDRGRTRVAGSGMSAASSSPARPPAVWVIAVKPDLVAAVASEYGADIREMDCLVSVAAGVSLAELTRLFGQPNRIFRAMPNSPVACNAGTLALAAAQSAGDIAPRVEVLFALLGRCAWFDERQFDTVTAVSGSGPAFLYYFLEQMIGAATALGLSADSAAFLCRQTMIGAARLLERDARPAAEMIADVASPGGTTEAGLRELARSGDVARVLAATLMAASRRAEELGGGRAVVSRP